ncbi:MAG: DUF4403 family protein [bacterium]
MNLSRLFLLFLVLFALGLGGCATVPNLYIPPSDAKIRAFKPPPPAIIRLPVSVSVPHWTVLSKGLTHWLDGRIRQIGENAQKSGGIVSVKSPLSGISGLWTDLQKPIFIDKNIWLVIRPEALSTGLAKPNQHDPLTWKVILEMTAHPILMFGEKPHIPRKVLPPLRHYKAGPSGFHAISNTAISFREANRILADPKSGLVNYPIRGSGSYHLRIKSVRLYGSGGQVIAQTRIEYNPLINLDGKPSRMTIYFRGVPKYDPKREIFYLRHLNFDVKTGDLLMQIASWIFKSDILSTLRKKAHIPIGAELNQLKKRMNVVLNCPVGKHSRLLTKVDSFRVLEARVNRDGIQAQMSLDGTARLSLFSH